MSDIPSPQQTQVFAGDVKPKPFPYAVLRGAIDGAHLEVAADGALQFPEPCTQCGRATYNPALICDHHGNWRAGLMKDDESPYEALSRRVGIASSRIAMKGDAPTRLILGRVESKILNAEMERQCVYRTEAPVERPQFRGLSVYVVDADEFLEVLA